MFPNSNVIFAAQHDEFAQVTPAADPTLATDPVQSVYKAAETKDQDQILDAADKLAVACSHCHNVYREKTPEQGGEKNRCVNS